LTAGLCKTTKKNNFHKIRWPRRTWTMEETVRFWKQSRSLYIGVRCRVWL